jgi:hypothetical protein
MSLKYLGNGIYGLIKSFRGGKGCLLHGDGSPDGVRVDATRLLGVDEAFHVSASVGHLSFGSLLSE